MLTMLDVSNLVNTVWFRPFNKDHLTQSKPLFFLPLEDNSIIEGYLAVVGYPFIDMPCKEFKNTAQVFATMVRLAEQYSGYMIIPTKELEALLCEFDFRGFTVLSQ